MQQNLFAPRVRLRRAGQIRVGLRIGALLSLWLWVSAVIGEDAFLPLGVPGLATAVFATAQLASDRTIAPIAVACHAGLGLSLVALIARGAIDPALGWVVCALFGMGLPAFAGLGVRWTAPVAAITMGMAIVAADGRPPAEMIPVLIAALLIGTGSGWRSARTEHDDLLARVELERLADRLFAEAKTDPLTSLPNRQHVQGWLEQAWEHSRHASEDLSLLVVDIDRFKRVNDTHGHPTGDRVIQDVAEAIQGALRRQDLAGRWGGEEFVVVLHSCPSSKVRVLAERIRQAVEGLELPMPGHPAIRPTVSIGAATWSGDPDVRPHHLVALADQALYQAKGRGRNQVVFASDATVD